MEASGKKRLIQPGKLSDTDWKSIELFKKRAEQLRQCELVKAENEVNAHVRADKNGMKFDVELPKEDLLKSLLLSFRPFYSNDEPSNFLRVINILQKGAVDQDDRNILEGYKSGWKNALLAGALQFSDKDGRITASRILDLWFNAHYFHNDEKKLVALQAIDSVLTSDFSKYLLVDSVYRSVGLISQIYNAIKGVSKAEIEG